MEKKFRPKIETISNKGIKNIIRACWQSEDNLRPTFYEVNDALTRVTLGDSGWKLSSGFRGDNYN